MAHLGCKSLTFSPRGPNFSPSHCGAETAEGYDLLLGHVAAHCCQGVVIAGQQSFSVENQ